VGGPACKSKEPRGFVCKTAKSRRGLTGGGGFDMRRTDLIRWITIRRSRTQVGAGGSGRPTTSGGAHRRSRWRKRRFGARVPHSPRGLHQGEAHKHAKTTRAPGRTPKRRRRRKARWGGRRWQRKLQRPHHDDAELPDDNKRHHRVPYLAAKPRVTSSATARRRTGGSRWRRR
jgi:hypothetical protein